MADILLIEDSKKLSHDLGIVFEFIGERLIPVARSSWRDDALSLGVSPEKLRMVLVGHYKDSLLANLLQDIVAWDPYLPIVLLNGQDMPELAEAIRNRVVATLQLPLSYQPVLDALHKAQVQGTHFARPSETGGASDYSMFRSLVGTSPAVQKIRQLMSQVADTEVTVLILGESGTGKEVVARNLHGNSRRASKPFVPINCGAIPPDLLESELFGHEKGAFTGAISTRIGRFELAQGGTLFLDEIGDMPPNMQVKLLRVLQEQCFERVGGTKTMRTDVRILAATHRHLEDMITIGSFRQDLYYRLNVFPIEMPSLRERSSDVPNLLNELITRLEYSKRGSVRFNSAAIRALCMYSWPGNVRELANLVERMAIMHPNAVVGVHDLPRQFQLQDEDVPDLNASEVKVNKALVPFKSDVIEDNNLGDDADQVIPDSHRDAGDRVAQDPHPLPLNGLDLKEYLANQERNLIAQALDDCSGVVARAADRLNIRRTTLVEKMRKYDMTR